MKHRHKSLLCIRIGKFEIQRYAPPNFYSWSEKAQAHYLLKRWPSLSGCCNGAPFECGGRKVGTLGKYREKMFDKSHLA